ncbi:MAG: isochorismate synthase [Planctomycetota bacterium]
MPAGSPSPPRFAPPAPWSEAATALRLALRSLPDAAPGPILRLTAAVQPIDPLAWLQAQPTAQRFFWGDRSGTTAAAGSGLAWSARVEDFAALRLAPLLATDARVWLTSRFDCTAPAAAEWQEFGAVCAYLPRVELRRQGERHELAVHLTASTAAERAAAVRALEELCAPATALGATPRLAPIEATAAAERVKTWTREVAATLSEIRSGRLHKVVLARHEDFQAAPELCPIAVLRALGTHNRHTFQFCVQPQRGVAFVGTSPERLYRRCGIAVESEAVAGTRPRDADADRDRQLANELARSDKDTREHHVVCDHIRRELEPLCSTLRATPTEVERWTDVQHLRTGFSGDLRAETDDAQLLACLHPTPAVCGVPASAARRRISASEPFDRGLYCGTVGWLGAAASECAVAIRSVLVAGNRVRAYAGAGIVDGSHAATEWEEIATKLRVLTPLLEPNAG